MTIALLSAVLGTPCKWGEHGRVTGTDVHTTNWT